MNEVIVQQRFEEYDDTYLHIVDIFHPSYIFTSSTHIPPDSIIIKENENDQSNVRQAD